MAFFTRSFKSHIQEELRARTEFEHVQSVLVPHVRVTSLITTNEHKFKGELLHGFTLGIPDPNILNSLDSYFNTNQQGTVVGLTYTNNEGPKVVRIPTGNKKLPVPGITNVEISTQAKGGFIFKAVINLKFYGREQYDFIYQTFMRPGNQIAIEYGHTRQDVGEYSQVDKDLGFFRTLNANLIETFKDSLYGNKPITSTRNSGTVVGFVTNFSIKLNENNEYEATVDLMNALEFLYTMNPEDTFLSYGGRNTATNRRLNREDQQSGEVAEWEDVAGSGAFTRSIRANFGQLKDEDYDPEYDQMLRTVLNDAVLDEKYTKNILLPHEFVNPNVDTGVDSTTGSPELERIQAWVAGNPENDPFKVRHEYTEPTAAQRERYGIHARSVQGELKPGMEPFDPSTGVLLQEEVTFLMETQQVGLSSAAGVFEGVLSSSGDRVYVSLDYFFNRLLSRIISYSFRDMAGVFSSQKYDIRAGVLIVLPTSTVGAPTTTFRDRSNWIAGSSTSTAARQNPTTLRASTIADESDYAVPVELLERNEEIIMDNASFVGYWPELRSNNINKVIINNANIYRQGAEWMGTYRGNLEGRGAHFSEEDPEGLPVRVGHGMVPIIHGTYASWEVTPDESRRYDRLSSGWFYQRRRNAYMEKFDQEQIHLLFKFNRRWYHKNYYKQGSRDSLHKGRRTGFDGIFVNYITIRNAFLNSRSVAEAIQKILFTVNDASGNVLKLKMRQLPRILSTMQEYRQKNRRIAFERGQIPFVKEVEPEAYNIVIYDESVLPTKTEVDREDPYTFFENNKSEAMSYDFDFSLPSSIAATVMSNTFEEGEESDAGGDPMNKALIKYGYTLVPGTNRLVIKNLIEFDPSEATLSERGIYEWPGRLKAGKPSISIWSSFLETLGIGSTMSRAEEALLREVESQSDFRDLLGYRELTPAVMKANIISDGLYNTIPSAATINIKLQGLDGFRFGDMFTVENVLPEPYDKNNIFMLTGYKHTIDATGWFTDIQAICVVSKADLTIEENYEGIPIFSVPSFEVPDDPGAGTRPKPTAFMRFFNFIYQ